MACDCPINLAIFIYFETPFFGFWFPLRFGFRFLSILVAFFSPFWMPLWLLPESFCTAAPAPVSNPFHCADPHPDRAWRRKNIAQVGPNHVAIVALSPTFFYYFFLLFFCVCIFCNKMQFVLSKKQQGVEMGKGRR